MLLESYLNLTKKSIGLDPANKYIYNPYFDSFLILLLFFTLSKLVVFISTKILLKIAKKTKTNIDDLIVAKSNGAISLVLFLIGLRLAILPLGIRPSISNLVQDIIRFLIIIVLTYIAIVISDILLDSWGKRHGEKNHSIFNDEVIPIFKKFLRIFISFLGILFLLPILGIQIGPLLTSLGIAGIAIAFALQSTLGNIFGGASILIDKSVRVNDIIKLDNETIGTIVEVGLRSTKIKTFDNELVTIPNGKLADSKIINFLQPDPTIRFAVDFGVEYGSDTSMVRKIVLDVVKKVPEVLTKPKPKVLMIEMGDSAVKFTVLFWVAGYSDKYDDTKALVVENVYNALRKGGIGIPFPTRTVYLKKGKK